MSSNISDHDLILFDGVCNFCNSSINFILKNDTNNRFKFASIQSDTGKLYIKKYQLQELDSVIVITRNKALIKSDAFIHILGKLGSIYSVSKIFKLVPLKIRNAVYDFIAQNRYKWFGKSNTCRIPTSEERSKFIS
ncbi:MAG: DUF393 domain-containing protein [Cytophagales bacterium]